MRYSKLAKTTLFISLLTCVLFGGLSCEDPAQPSSSLEGCEALASECPDGTSCQLDAVGNPFCAIAEPPLLSPGGAMENLGGVMTSGVMSGGEVSVVTPEGGLSVGGVMSGGVMSGGVMSGGVMSGGVMGGDCQGFRTSLKPTRGSISEVMLVVDRSHSMVNTEDRWSPAMNAISQVTDSLGDGVSFGLTLFPDPIDTTGEQGQLAQCTSWGRDQYSCEEDIAACAPGRVMLEPELNNGASILELLNTHRPLPNLGTPTYSALKIAGDRLLASAQGGSKVILLITDGMPSCNFELTPTTCTCLTTAPFYCSEYQFTGMCLDDQRTLDEVTRLASQGVQTVVVGLTIGLPAEGPCIADIGCPYGGQGCVNQRCVNLAPSVLSELARVGGSPTGSYFSVDELSELSRQLTQAAGGFTSCVFDISTIPAERYPMLSVYIDAELVPRDEGRMNGWWAEAGQLELYGAACVSIRDGRSHQVSARCE